MMTTHQQDPQPTGPVADRSGRAAWRRSSRSGTSGNCLEAAAFGLAEWRKSSFSGSESNCIEAAVVVPTAWSKSSHSGTQGNCVEVAGRLDAVVAVRDSKDPNGAKLVFAAAAWRQFTETLKVQVPTRS